MVHLYQGNRTDLILCSFSERFSWVTVLSKAKVMGYIKDRARLQSQCWDFGLFDHIHPFVNLSPTSLHSIRGSLSDLEEGQQENLVAPVLVCHTSELHVWT